jgi:SAM-dependent methyltransferase
MPESKNLDATELTDVVHRTLAFYDDQAQAFWNGTRDHDVSQNRAALLRHLAPHGAARILDLGCGPGRDLIAFKSLGHDPIGLDGSAKFCAMARDNSGCEVLHQDMLNLSLTEEDFDGVFANASLFHVPTQVLPSVLKALWRTLHPRGVLFASNPRGNGEEGWQSGRYGAFHDHDVWRGLVEAAGFEELEHYYRPAGRPRQQQPWLASVFRKV